MNTITLFTTTRPKDVTAKMASLEHAYLRAFKRKLPVDLFMADLPGNGPRWGITTRYTPEQAEAVDFLRAEAQRAA